MVIKTLVKVLFALGAVFAMVLLVRHYLEQKSDYIEIYNDDLDEGLFE